MLTNACQLPPRLGDRVGHVKETDERLIGSFDKFKLERVAIEGNALQAGEDDAQQTAPSNCESLGRLGRIGNYNTIPDPSNLRVAKDLVLMPVGKSPCRLREGGRETISVGLIVRQLRVHKVVNLCALRVIIASSVSCSRSTTRKSVLRKKSETSLTMLLMSNSLPNTKSLTASKKGFASLSLFLNSSEALRSLRCF